MHKRTTRRRLLLGATAAAGAALAGMRGATAQSYPRKTVTIVNPFAPGSISDATARIIANFLQQELGQPFIVENRVGAAGLLAAGAVQRAQPDGYTLLLSASSAFAGSALFKSMPFDPVKDFTHIVRMGSFPSFIAINPTVPAATIQEFVAHAKANPGKLSYGFGNNSGQIAGEALKIRTGVDIARVAYRSTPAGMTDLIAGHIQMMVPDLQTGLEASKAGRIRPLAMMSRTRSPELPDVPTLDETVMPGFDILPFCGLSAPVGLPGPIREVLTRTVEKALATPEVRQRFSAAGVGIITGGPDDYGEYVRVQTANWTQLIRETGIQPE
jgi:tripartite-type tricarboxylate transporter receptor subunit TctC